VPIIRIERVNRCKTGGGALASFNLSVQVSDEFMAGWSRPAFAWPFLPMVSADGEPAPRSRCGVDGSNEASPWVAVVCARASFGSTSCALPTRVASRGDLRRPREPGNNLWYRERPSPRQSCGELPLPPYGACNLGSLILPRFVREPFTPRAVFDFDALAATAALAVRFLDDVIDVSHFPLPEQAPKRAPRTAGAGRAVWPTPC